MAHYYLLRSLTKLGEGLYGLKHTHWGQQCWSICKVYKDYTCVMTSQKIKKGKEAYRPITNGGNRSERISKAFFESNQ